MKKRIGLIAGIMIVLLVLCFPISRGPYDDGGTRTYDALIYKVVHWNRFHTAIDENGKDSGNHKYQKTSVFFFPNNLKSIDALWEMEMAKEKKDVSDDTQQFVFHSSGAFAKYLDDVNFVSGLDQGDFIAQVGKYRYDQKAVTEIVGGLHWDGNLSSGWRAVGASFGFVNDFTVTEDREYANHSNSLYTSVPLDGLELPFGIYFDDTITTALQKLEIDMDLQSGFVWDEDNVGTMILYRDDRSSLQLTNNTRLKTSSMLHYDYVLAYTENYQSTLEDGRETSVTRHVILSFSGDHNKLGLLEISVNDKIKYN